MRIEGMASLVVARVLSLQKEQKEAASVLAELSSPNGTGASEKSEEPLHV